MQHGVGNVCDQWNAKFNLHELNLLDQNTDWKVSHTNQKPNVNYQKPNVNYQKPNVNYMSNINSCF